MKTCICLLFITCVSCAPVQMVTINSGCFQHVIGDMTTTIVLKKDHQFTFIKSYGTLDIKCKGRWEYISKDTIILRCEQEPLEKAIVLGYMPVRNHKIKVINANKLKLLDENTTHKRKYFILNKVYSLCPE